MVAACAESSPVVAVSLFYSSFVKDYPLVVGKEVLSQEVPYRGGNSESKFYVEGLRFPDSDFDGLVQINLSLLEPSSKVLYIWSTCLSACVSVCLSVCLCVCLSTRLPD